MEWINIDTIIQGGAVGISILLILLIAFIIRRVFNFMGNHINSNTQAIDRNTEITARTNEAIDGLCNWLKKNGS